VIRILLLISALAGATSASAQDKGALEQLAVSAPNAEAAVADPVFAKISKTNQRYWIVVAARTRDERTRLATLGMSIEEYTGETVSGIVSEKTLARIKSRGFTVKSEITLESFPQADSRYHDYKAAYSELQSIAAALSDYSSLYSIGKSAEGRDIWCLRLSKTAKSDAAAAAPGSVMIGGHHAREHLSVEIPLLFARWLADNKDKSDVKAALDSRDIFIIPMLNPDGAEYDIQNGSYRYWRKTTRKLPGGEMGVDLNRNYSYLWGQGGSSADPDDETYMGPSAFSEPETQALKQLFDTHANIATCNAYHSYGRVIYYPWSGASADIANAQDLAAHKAIAKKMGEFTGYTPRKSSDAYISTGDMNDWSYDAHHVFSFTTELDPGNGGVGGFYPGPAAIDRAAPGNIKAMFYLVQISDNPLKAQ
jgi:carboxypeptidase T